MPFNFENIFLHGTNKSLVELIMKNGLLLREGRATFTRSPKYAINFSTKNPIKDGVLVIVKSGKIKRAKDSEIVLNKKDKIITGWPNRWRTEQFGYYSNALNPILRPKNIVAMFYYNHRFIYLIASLYKEIIRAAINQNKIKKYCAEIQTVLSNKRLQVIKPNVSLKKISQIMVYGMIYNLILREIRAGYISYLVSKGWKIYNPGQDPCDRWIKSKNDIMNQRIAISKIINKNFISPNIKKEFFLRMSKIE